MYKQSVEKQKIKAVVLVGSRDFGRSELVSRLRTALWPVAGKPALEHLLDNLAEQGVKRAVVCSGSEDSLLARSINADSRLELEFLDESLPAGTAGCIRDAARDEKDTLLLVFPGSLICPPKLDMLISEHLKGRCDLTVVLNPCHGNVEQTEQTSGIYVCNPTLLEHIPEEGYFDIKEGLIPVMLRAGKTVHAARLPNHAGNFRDRQGYLYAVANYLESIPKLNMDLKSWTGTDSQTVWMTANAKVDPEAQIYGSVFIMDDTNISKGAVIIGPTILGRSATIGKDSIVVNSMLWDGAQVGSNCRIQRCIIDYHAALCDNTVIEEKSITFKPNKMLERSVSRASEVAKNNPKRLHQALQSKLDKINKKLPDWVQSNRNITFILLASGLILFAFFWSYWHGLVDLWNMWRISDEYSSGLLVPFLAVYILWSKRHDIAQCRIRPCYWGLFAFVFAQAVRIFGLFFMYGSAERLSIALTIAAVVLLLFGWQLFRKIFPVLLFLCLMLPPPNRIHDAVALPLQRWATLSAVFCLEMIYEVVQDGNVIRIGDASVAVLEACNGLRMVTAFFVIGGFVVLLVERAWWEKLIVLVSSLPIALLCNTVRLAITAVFFTVIEGENWEKIFHDFGGYAMMPLALAAIVAELWLLAKLTTLPTKEEKIVITRQSG
jgi:exosortase